MGTEAVVVPFRRRLIWRCERGERRLVVGDRVVLEGTNPSLVVSEVEPRQSLLTRRSPGERRSRVLAANIDQAVVVLAAVSPEPNTRLLDRLLVACHHAAIHPLICINKIDKGLGDADSWLADYHTAGYQVFMASARTARGIGTLTRALNGKTTLFCGPSGVGKSALLNAIHPGYRLKEGSISEATGRVGTRPARRNCFLFPTGVSSWTLLASRSSASGRSHRPSCRLSFRRSPPLPRNALTPTAATSKTTAVPSGVAPSRQLSRRVATARMLRCGASWKTRFFPRVANPDPA